MALLQQFRKLAATLQEAALMNSDVVSRLTDALRDIGKGGENYYYYLNHTGSDSVGFVVYMCNGDCMQAPYTISGSEGTASKCTIDMKSAVDVIPRTIYEPEADDPISESGARNSKPDKARIQTIHDHAMALGATCGNKEAANVENDGIRLVESAPCDILQFTESSVNPLVKIISAGRGSTGYYTEDLLKRDGPKIFKRGTLMYINHATDAEEASRPEGDWSKLAAVTTGDAYWDQQGKDGPALYAPAKVFSNVAAEVREKAPYTGVSIRAAGMYAESSTGIAKSTIKFGESKLAPDGKPGLIGALTRADSIDLVTKAGRDGKLLLESAIPTQGDSMNEAEIKKLQESLASQAVELRRLRERQAISDAAGEARKYFSSVTVSEAIQERVLGRVLAGTIPLTESGDLDTAKLTARVDAETKDEVAYIAKLSGGRIVTGMGTAVVATEAQVKESNDAAKRALDQSASMYGFEHEVGKRIFNEGRGAFDPTYNSRVKEVAN